MTQRRFNMWDRVRIVRTTNPELVHLIGVPTTIVGTVGAKSRYVGQFLLDLPPPKGKKQVCARPDDLRHFYDGDGPSSWAECVWRPTGIKQ